MIRVILIVAIFLITNDTTCSYETDNYDALNDTNITTTYVIAIGLCQDFNLNISQVDLVLEVDLDFNSTHLTNATELVQHCYSQCCNGEHNEEDQCDLFVFDYNKNFCNQFSCKNDCVRNEDVGVLAARIKRNLRQKRKVTEYVDFGDIIHDTMSKLNATKLNSTTTTSTTTKKSTRVFTTSKQKTTTLVTSTTTSTTTTPELTTNIPSPFFTEPLIINEFDKFIQENASLINGLQSMFFFDNGGSSNISSAGNGSLFEGFYFIFLMISAALGIILSFVALIVTIRFCLKVRRQRSYDALGYER